MECFQDQKNCMSFRLFVNEINLSFTNTTDADILKKNSNANFITCYECELKMVLVIFSFFLSFSPSLGRDSLPDLLTT